MRYILYQCIYNFFLFSCSLFTNMANSVIVRQGMDKSDEYCKCFPPFLWLLRDVLVHMPERNGRELTPTEFLTTEVLDGDNSDRMKVAVRKTLTRCFPTFECKTLPPPSTDTKVMAKVSTSLKKLDSLFNQGVDELITFIKANIKAKKVFDAAGAKCDGPTFAIFVKKINEAVNDPQSIPALDSTWKLVVESRCRSVQERLLSEYCNTIKDRYDETSKGGPIEEVADNELEYKKSLMGIHDTLWSELRKQLNDEIGSLITLTVAGEWTLEMMTDQLEKQLIQILWEPDPGTKGKVKKVVGGALLPIAEENRKRSWEFCNQLFTDLYTPIREKVQTTKGEDGYTPDKLAGDIKALLQEYDAKSVGPEKWKVRTVMETTINQNKQLLQKHLHVVMQHAKEAKEMYENLRNELQELKESRTQMEKKFDEFAKQQEEAEERRQQEVETEMKQLKKKLQEQEQKVKEMNAKEMKRRVEEAQRLMEESVMRERAEEKLKEMEKQKAKEDMKIQEIMQNLRQKAQKEAEAAAKHEIKSREKAEECHEQHLIIERMKADYELMLHKIRQEKGKERKQKELVQDEKTRKKLQKECAKHFSEKESEISALSNRIGTEVESMTEEKGILSSKFKTLSEEKGTLPSQVATLFKEKGTLSSKVETLWEEKGALSSHVAILSKDKGTLSSKVATLSKYKGALTSKVETLSKDKGALTSKGEILSKDKGALTSKVETLSKDKGALTSKVETLSKDKGALTSKVETLSKEKEAVSSEVYKLNMQRHR